jgi:hypothetical protein
VREYDWTKANIDPKSHRFGLVDRKGQQSSVKQVGGQQHSCCCTQQHRRHMSAAHANQHKRQYRAPLLLQAS